MRRSAPDPEDNVREDDQLPLLRWARSDPALGTSVAVVGLVVYGRTALRGPGLGDTAKFQFVGHILGIPHATGYPLYILVSYVASEIPVGALATRANLLSAVCAALAVGLVFAILRTLTVARVPAVAASLFFAVTPTLWSQATIAEVYALEAALMALAILCLLRWWTTDSSRWLIAALAVEAASLGNHMLTLTLALATIWLLWRGRDRIGATVLKAAAACALIPVALYSTLYVWTEVRPAAYLEQPVSSLHDLRNVVTGSEFGGSMFAFSPADIVRDRLPLMWDELWHQFGWLTAVLVLGAVVLARRDRAVAGFLALIVAVDLFVIANYSIFDIFIYFLPAWIACAIALGIGFDAILQRISAPVAAASVAVIALLLPVWPAADNWSEQNLSHGIPEAEPVRALLNATPDHSLILARVSDYNVAELMWYFLFGEGLTAAPDLTLYFDYDAGEVCRYLRNGVPPDTTWRRHVYRDGHATPLDERPPAGLHVIVLGDLHPELAARGFTAAPLGPGVLELQPPATCPES